MIFLTYWRVGVGALACIAAAYLGWHFGSLHGESGKTDAVNAQIALCAVNNLGMKGISDVYQNEFAGVDRRATDASILPDKACRTVTVATPGSDAKNGTGYARLDAKGACLARVQCQ